MDDHSSAAPVTRAVKLPTRTFGLKRPCGGLRPEGRTFPRKVPIRHCSGWGLPYRPGCPVRGGLLPHRFTITMDPFKASPEHHGSLFSVALSLRLPSPGITRHPYFMESGLSSKAPTFRQNPPRSPSHPRKGAVSPSWPQFKPFRRSLQPPPHLPAPGPPALPARAPMAGTATGTPPTAALASRRDNQ